MNSVQSISILIVEKSGNIKPMIVKDFKQEELFKKCGFKKGEDFLKQVDWKIKLGNNKWYLFDDSSYSEITTETELTKHLMNAYWLCYKKHS